MAFTHILIGQNSTHGPILRGYLQQLESGYRGLITMIPAIQTMIDGDGSSATMFPEVTARFGTQSDDQSKAMFEELESLVGKLTSDATQDHVAAAINQALAKMR